MAEKTMAKSTFSNLRQVAIVVRDLEKTVSRLESLGIGPFKRTVAPDGAEGLFFRGKILDRDKSFVTSLGSIEFEIIEPDNTPSPWKEFLDTKGEGIHHLAFQVDDVEKEVNRLTSQGAELILTGKIKGKLGAAYVDLKAGNILVELIGFSSIMK
jgi:methylmalonyl-CoA/ethylmalonyl-CoA epimerase